MEFTENKPLIFTIASVIFLLFISSMVNFFSSKWSNKYAIEYNKTFNLSVEKNENGFVFSTKNHLKKLDNLNKFIPNISLMIYDINVMDQSKFFDLLEMPSDVKFGLSEFDKSSLEKLKHYNHHFLLKLDFNEQKDTRLFIDKNQNLEKNSNNISIINGILKSYNSGIYIKYEDISGLENNQSLVEFLSNLQPFIINTNNICDKNTKICFISDINNLNKIAPMQLQEILENQKQSNDKWFIVMKYDSEHMMNIKKLVTEINSGFININDSVLNQIMQS